MNSNYTTIRRIKSVQDQNDVVKNRIRSIARWWQSGNRLPKPIEDLVSDSRISRENAILVEQHDGDYQCQISHSGCFLTRSNGFWSYELDLNEKETEIEYLEHWGKINLEVNQHLKGTGKSFGYLCTEVLNETEN